MSSSKKINLQRDFAAGVYQIDWRYSHSCWFFDPALWTVSPLTFSLVSSTPPPLPCVNKYTVYMYTVYKGAGLRQINTCHKVPLCSVAQLGCSVAQLVARWLAVRQARVRISARHPMEDPPTEPTAVKTWRWASANVYEWMLCECI
jgi:hypothetical protein